MEFEAYLISKKIDSAEFQKREPGLWSEWKRLFDEMHPSSFTMQKLNLINPVRRKYQLKIEPPKPEPVAAVEPSPQQTEMPAASSEPQSGHAAPKPAKPVFKPRPKFK